VVARNFEREFETPNPFGYAPGAQLPLYGTTERSFYLLGYVASQEVVFGVKTTTLL